MSTNSAATTAKERHYAHLASRLHALSRHVDSTQHNLTIAAQQALYVRKLGASQAALFMAALHQVDQEAMAGAEDEEAAAATAKAQDPKASQ